MDKEWIPLIGTVIAVIGTLLGATLGGVVTSVVKIIELRHQKKEQSKQLLLSKLEQLYTLIGDYTADLNRFWDGIIDLHTSSKEAIEYHKLIYTLRLPMSLISTLLRIYAPELEDDFKKLQDAIVNFDRSGEEFSVKKIPMEEFSKHYSEVMDKIMSLRIVVAEKARHQLQNKTTLQTR